LLLTEYAANLGYDVAMVRTPHYYKSQMKPANMLAFYRTVADRSPLPVHHLQLPASHWIRHPGRKIVIELADHPNLIASRNRAATWTKSARWSKARAT